MGSTCRSPSSVWTSFRACPFVRRALGEILSWTPILFYSLSDRRCTQFNASLDVSKENMILKPLIDGAMGARFTQYLSFILSDVRRLL